jgi:WD40 repeat protein/serine/threonine protein kinase
MTENDDLPGRRLGEFVVRELLARGGFGAVYRCEQRLLGREAVVKVLHRDLRKHHIILRRFMREAQLLSRLNHPYAAHVYAFGIEQDGLWWIAMERVEGVTLAERLTTHGPMPAEPFVPFFGHIAAVVQTAHDRGIVHRDLKPANIMVIERAGEQLPKLLDFGVAKLFDGGMLAEGMPDLSYLPQPATDAPASGISTVTSHSPPPHGDDAGLTRKNQTVGSPPYMSPEQWVHPAMVGPASDLYALAVVAFEALTGRRPFHAARLTDFEKLHLQGQVPALGGSFPPALDRMFQRALAKRPEDRFATALELADALRSASGLGASRAKLPTIDVGVRDAWLGEAPQPLAESVAALDGARNAHQARDAAQELVRTLLRYLLALALATRSPGGDDQDDSALLELVRALSKRALSAEERLQLLRLLVRPHGEHPVPELVDLVLPGPDGTDALEPILGLYSLTDHAGSEDAVRLRLSWLMPELTQLLRKTAFVLDYLLVVPRDHAAERWTGQRQPHRGRAVVVEGKLVDGHPMLLDRNGRICADLWPLVQAAPPSYGAEPELFVFDGRSRCGAQLIAAPRSIVRDDSNAWRWVATRLIAEVEAKARMHDQIRTAARQWQDQARPDGLLWRGNVLADFEVWTRHTSTAPLGDLEEEFIESCRRVARRARRIRRSLVAAGMLTVLAGVVTALGVVAYRAETKTRTAEQLTEMSITQADVERGRQALLHGEFAEALLYLTQAYQRGDHSPDVKFMLARALQPRLAEQARFTSASGRFWSALFSPDGKRIVTTDDECARVWDAQTNQLLFTLPHAKTVYQAVYTPDGTRLVTAGGDGFVKIWNAATGTLLRELTRQDAKPRRYFVVATSHDGKLVAAIDSLGEVAHVWDAGTGVLLAELRNDASEFPSLTFSSDGRWLATSGGDDVRVFDTTTWAQPLTLAARHVHRLAFDPTGPRLVTGTSDGDASIWEIPSGARLRHLREVGEPVDAVAYARNGELVVTAARDGAEQVWDARTGRLRSQGNYHRSEILSVEFDPTSTLVLAAGADGTVVVSDVMQGMPVAVLEGPENVVRVAHFDPSSHRVVGASRDGTARVWDATSPYRRWSSPPVSDDCGFGSSLEPDRRFVAIGCWGLNTRVWDTARDRLLAELPSVTPVDGDFSSAFPAVSAAGDRAAIARGNTVEIYELPGRQLLRTISHAEAVNAVAFAPTGHDLVSGAVDGSLLVTRDDREPIAFAMLPGGIDAAAILADGRVVAAAGKRLRVYDPDRNAVLAELEMPARVRTLRPSLDGLRLITVASKLDKTAPVLWDLLHYQRIVQLDGHGGPVFAARFVRAGHEILTAGGDGTARLWDGATGRLRHTYRGSRQFLADATIDPDGLMVVAGGGDGLLRFWDVSNERPLWTLQAHKSHVIGVHFEGDDIVTRGFGADVSRWRLPSPEEVIGKIVAPASGAASIMSR